MAQIWRWGFLRSTAGGGCEQGQADCEWSYLGIGRLADGNGVHSGYLRFGKQVSLRI